jgi:hypothetical protein
LLKPKAKSKSPKAKTMAKEIKFDIESRDALKRC